MSNGYRIKPVRGAGKGIAAAHLRVSTRLLTMVVGLVTGWLSVNCSHSTPSTLLRRETTRGEIQYTLHAPAAPASQQVILAHGFLRSPQTMDHLAKALAENGIETACIALKRSTPLHGNHVENARDIIALRESLGWQDVTYAGFSAGGLSALLAASEDKTCKKLLLLDPVDHGTLGRDAAKKIRIPTLAILGKPGPGNGLRNATPMLDAIPDCRIIEIAEANHFDFEANPSALLHCLIGSAPAADRTTAVHEKVILRSTRFLIHSNEDQDRMAVIRQAAARQEVIGNRDVACVWISGKTGEVVDFNPKISARRLPPCSTFKIWNALIGFEEKLITDPKEAFYQWDGENRAIAAWNRDLNLREAFQASCVPAFQALARRITEPRMNQWLGKIGYGDQNTRAGIDIFWLPVSGRETIRITAMEQAKLLHQLLSKELPIAASSITKLKNLMEIRKTDRGVLYGKTGSGSLDAPGRGIGWFVGFVESGGDTLIFACQLVGTNASGTDAHHAIEGFLTKHRLL